MSKKHPLIAITGSSGSGSHRVSSVFEHIAWREKISHLVVDGSAFHRYERNEMAERIERACADGHYLSHFSPDGNHLDKLEALFRGYVENGSGQFRHYLHTLEQAVDADQEAGTFTPWQPLPEGLDLLVYQGLHGAYSKSDLDLTQHVDLLIGVTPIVNLEWIQKIHTDISIRGYSLDEVRNTIQHRLHDYVRYITPQFSHTDINFQQIPLIDTSNPFESSEMPTPDESMVVISFRDGSKVDFPYLLKKIDGSFLSRRHCIVVPGGKMEMAMELLLMPIVHEMMELRRQSMEF